MAKPPKLNIHLSPLSSNSNNNNLSSSSNPINDYAIGGNHWHMHTFSLHALPCTRRVRCNAPKEIMLLWPFGFFAKYWCESQNSVLFFIYAKGHARDLFDAMPQKRLCCYGHLDSSLKYRFTPRVAIILGSDFDLHTMKDVAVILETFDIPYELTVVSAHRTPERMYSYPSSARGRGIQVIIAGAGGAAHLPGMVASLTGLPILGVPIKTSSINGLDSLLSLFRNCSNQSNMLILQESCTDSTDSYVIYAPVDVVAMNVVLNGGDLDYVTLLPSGL